MTKKILIILVVPVLMFSCKTKKTAEKDVIIKQRNTEAREDSVKMAEALHLQSKFENITTADFETTAVESLSGEDAADDPAIWVNQTNPEKSLVIGTNKKAGLYVYDLKGNQLQFLKAGNINNVDLRDGFKYGEKEVAIVVGSNRSLNTISIFYIDHETGILSDTIQNIVSAVDEVYGICMYKNYNNEYFVFVNGKGGVIEQWQLIFDNNEIKAELLRNFSVNSQPEGMVVDDKAGILYLGVEEEGILKTDANAQTETKVEWIAGSDSTNTDIAYDIEGLALYHTEDKTYLVASIQGSFSYAIFETGNPDKYLTSFIVANGVVDGIEETDGIDIVNAPLNEKFPKGLFVAQDGFNYQGDSMINQNFKYVSWEKIEQFISK